MKIVLGILGGLLALIVLLLLVRVRITALFKPGCRRLTLKILFWRMEMPPGERAPSGRKEKKPPEKKPDLPEKKETAPDVRNILHKINVFSGMIKQLISIVWNKLLRRIVWERLRFILVVSEEDAADTAIRYGQASAAVYNAAALLCNTFTVRRREVRVESDFRPGNAYCELDCEISLRVFHAAAALLAAAMVAFRNRRMIQREFAKGEETNERASD